MTTPSGDGRKQPEAQLLVVEDEPNILELLAASLRYAGFEVISASAGTEAVQAAQRHRPDLIVLDVMLPDMDGFDVVRRLRGGGDRIPVVFLTARDAMDDKIRGLTLGGDADPGRAAAHPGRRRRADAAAEVRRPGTRRRQP
jgi:two-component system OmpR family response regulator